MKKILFFLLISVSVNAQISTRCKVCPPSLDGVPDGYVLTDSSGYARWQASGGGGGSSWNLNGNAGTNPDSNFIGTTDNVDLYIKRNSIIAGAFSTGGAFNFGDLLGLGEKQKFGITGGVASLQMRRRFEVLDTTTAVLFKVDKANNRIQLGLNTLPLTDTGYSIGSSSFRLKEVRALRGYFDGSVTIADGTQGSGKTYTSDANGLAHWGLVLAADTFTPTVTSVTNIDSLTAYPAQYMRVGNTVTVSGQIRIKISGTGLYEIGVSLPIASEFTQTYQCAGSFTGTTTTPAASDNGYIKADATNNMASFNGDDNDTAYHQHYYTFTYTIY